MHYLYKSKVNAWKRVITSMDVLDLISNFFKKQKDWKLKNKKGKYMN